MQVARIKLTSTNYKVLDNVCKQIKDIALKLGVRVSGPVPLPTKKLKVHVRRSPCGDGSMTFDRYELRIHKRLIEVDANERVLRRIMRLQLPSDVHIEMEIISK